MPAGHEQLSAVPHGRKEREVLLRIERARQRIARILESHEATAQPGTANSIAFLGNAFAEFCDALSRILTDAIDGSRDPVSVAWVQHQFQDSMTRVAANIREAAAGPRVRHTLAQTLQWRMFEAEANLSRALGVPWGAGRTTDNRR